MIVFKVAIGEDTELSLSNCPSISAYLDISKPGCGTVFCLDCVLFDAGFCVFKNRKIEKNNYSE